MEVQVGDHVIVEYWNRCFGQYALNVRRYVIIMGLDGSPGSDQLMLNRWCNTAAFRFSACLPTAADFYGVRIRRIQSNPPPPLEKVQITPGQIDSDPLPLQTALVYTGSTGQSGRRHKVRSYIPFPPEMYNTAGASPSGEFTALTNTLGAMLTRSVSLSPGLPTITARALTTGTIGGSYAMIEHYVVHNEWGTMRTRSQISGIDQPPF